MPPLFHRASDDLQLIILTGLVPPVHIHNVVGVVFWEYWVGGVSVKLVQLRISITYVFWDPARLQDTPCQDPAGCDELASFWPALPAKVLL